MSERPADIPPFTVDGVEFRCLVVTEDDGSQRYVWRSACGRFAVGRRGRECWARSDGHVVGADFPSLKPAMIAAVRAARQEAA